MTYSQTTPTTDKNADSHFSPANLFSTPLLEDEALDTAINSLTLTLARFAPAELPNEDLLPVRETELSFPAQKSNVYTARLRGLLPIFIAQLISMFSVDAVQRGAKAQLWEIKRALRALYRTEKQNYVASMTAAVQADLIWQAGVRADLGGEAALTRWEVRRDKRLDFNESAPNAPTQTGTDIPQARPSRNEPRKPSRPLSDRHGLFRLASLARPRTNYTGTRRQTQRGVSASFPAPPLIGLTPDQLRPSANAHQAPPIKRKRLQKTWRKMQEQHFHWNDLLVIIDFMTMSRSFREEYAPP